MSTGWVVTFRNGGKMHFAGIRPTRAAARRLRNWYRDTLHLQAWYAKWGRLDY